ncbi:hypothetical protein [Bacillus phage YungSlug]|nr:hypothetical protein [Bacillus phage YungSlug]
MTNSVTVNVDVNFYMTNYDALKGEVPIVMINCSFKSPITQNNYNEAYELYTTPTLKEFFDTIEEGAKEVFHPVFHSLKVTPIVIREVTKIINRECADKTGGITPEQKQRVIDIIENQPPRSVVVEVTLDNK